ncbi:MAG: serine/threonine protein kinase [Planctomycetota bacterium]|nr:MAG: serine/threonine protein kinase [Planctomycetota bacterium]
MKISQLVDLNKFEIVREIAKGGMGTVYEALQHGVEGFRKTVALKVILGEYSRDPEFVEMFIGEAKLVADLVHQNIVQIYQLGKMKNYYYIAMEYINGVNLKEFIERHIQLGREIPIELAAFIVSRVCRGLEYAHKKTDRRGRPLNVVHRDISPANIMLTFEGVVKITDFGIAKAANLMRDREGEVLMGKLRYMSPEQAQYKKTDNRSDLFSLGVVLYELLSGSVLFEEGDTQTTIDNILYKEIQPLQNFKPEVPDELNRIVMKALSRKPEKRYQSAGEMGYDLEHYMYHNRFGPTNVTLEQYLKKIFPSSNDSDSDPTSSSSFSGEVDVYGDTDIL